MKIKLNAFTMAYTDVGVGAPLLFIHGFPLNRRMWEPQVSELAQVGRVLAPDLRGHGDSPPLPGPYEMALLADDLNAFLDALSIGEPVVLCGLSMGGYVAFAFYRRYAHRTRALILTATRAAADTLDGKAGRDAMAGQVQKAGIEGVIDGMAPKLVAPHTVSDRPELVIQFKEIMQSTSPEGMVGALMGMKARPDSTPLLSQIKAPALVVHGAEDQIVPLDEARAMAEAIPGAQFVVIPQAGHLLNLEQPEVYNQVLIDFLGSL
jgi:pimeloyl-ACP methyl ester carboxylesterase